MTNYLSKKELNKLSEGLLKVYVKRFGLKNLNYIDIEHFITAYLNIKIRYVSFAGEDEDMIGYISNGLSPVYVYSDGIIVSVVFPKDTILVDRCLLDRKENGRRRFTLAHEASHYVLNKVNKEKSNVDPYFEANTEYTTNDVANIIQTIEWQADTMAASLLMPKELVYKQLKLNGISGKIKRYGDAIIQNNEKTVLKNIACTLGVSYTALVIRLKEIGMIEEHDIADYIENELSIGGN